MYAHPAKRGDGPLSGPTHKNMPEYFTKEGLEELKKELNRLKTDEIRKISELIKNAASFGDLKENFAYHDAKDRQAFLQGKISELETKVNNAVIIEKNQTDKVQVGSKIKVLTNGEEWELSVVGSDMSDPANNKISYQSPVGKALMGKKVGEEVKMEINGEEVKYKILEIE
jgi:transcription elongation factor GreA